MWQTEDIEVVHFTKQLTDRQLFIGKSSGNEYVLQGCTQTKSLIVGQDGMLYQVKIGPHYYLYIRDSKDTCRECGGLGWSAIVQGERCSCFHCKGLGYASIA